MLYGPAQKSVGNIIHIVGDAAALILSFGNIPYGHQLHGTERSCHGNRLYIRTLCSEFIILIVTVPVCSALYIILTGHLLYEMAQHAGTGEWFIVDGDDADTACLKAFVQIDAHCHAF